MSQKIWTGPFINPFQDKVWPGVSNSGMTFSKIENLERMIHWRLQYRKGIGYGIGAPVAVRPLKTSSIIQPCSDATNSGIFNNFFDIFIRIFEIFAIPKYFIGKLGLKRKRLMVFPGYPDDLECDHHCYTDLCPVNPNLSYANEKHSFWANLTKW